MRNATTKRTRHRQPPAVGERFGMLTVTRSATPNRHGDSRSVCSCDCGETSTTLNYRLRSGETRSCGCRRWAQGPTGEAARNEALYNFRKAAGYRSYAVELSDDEILELMEQPCYWCGAERTSVSGATRPSGAFHHNGIDRYDNTFPYTVENCVPSCGRCNKAKLAMSPADFLSMCHAIAARHPRRGAPGDS